MSDKNNSYLNLILRCIPKGSTRARNLRDVAIMADVSERQTQEYIRQLREAGHPIVSMSSGGYFIPDENDPLDIAEAERYMAMMRGQATERLQTVKAIEHWLERRRKPVQMNLDAYIKKR
jgi:predicted DNA-binding transcriptional regulator YafY